jgi:hypothetical protein
MSWNRPRVLVCSAVCALAAGCASAPAKRCTGMSKGPRPQTYTMAALPSGVTSAMQASGQVLGSISDVETGLGVAYAMVLIRTDTTSRATAFVNADSAGGFVLASIRPARYFLEARALGYPPVRKSIEVRANTVDTVSVPLRFNPYYLDCETVITR